MTTTVDVLNMMRVRIAFNQRDAAALSIIELMNITRLPSIALLRALDVGFDDNEIYIDYDTDTVVRR